MARRTAVAECHELLAPTRSVLHLAQPASATLSRRWQKASLHGWMGGSVCTVAAECNELLAQKGIVLPQSCVTSERQPVSRRWQKASLYGWMGGSVCTVAAECYELLALTAVRRDGESEAAWQARQARALAEVDGRLLVLFHALVQARHAPRKDQEVTLIG